MHHLICTHQPLHNRLVIPGHYECQMVIFISYGTPHKKNYHGAFGGSLLCCFFIKMRKSSAGQGCQGYKVCRC